MLRMDRLVGKNFLVLGRVGMDFYADPPGTPIVGANQFFACIGGSSANIAVALTRLGAKAALITSVSDDAVGRFCLAELEQYGVDHRYVRTVGGEARTSLSVVETRLEDCQAVIYRNGAADFQMTPEDVAAVDMEPYSGLIVTGTALAAEPSRVAALEALIQAKTAGMPVILDIDYRPYSWPSPKEAADTYARAAAECDIVVGNDDEFGVLAGNYDHGLDAARTLVAKSATIAVYKMGEKGAVTITKDNEITTGIFPTKALKPTGAGDSFMGGFISGLANGLSVRDAVLRGSAAAAIVVARVGCAPAMPTAEELDSFLNEQT